MLLLCYFCLLIILFIYLFIYFAYRKIRKVLPGVLARSPGSSPVWSPSSSPGSSPGFDVENLNLSFQSEILTLILQSILNENYSYILVQTTIRQFTASKVSDESQTQQQVLDKNETPVIIERRTKRLEAL